MPKAASRDLQERVLALLREGLSVRGVEARLRAEGTPLGKSAIAELDKRRRAEGRPSPPAEGEPWDPIGGDPAELDVGQLGRVAAKLTERLEHALATDDFRALSQLTPLRLQVSATLARVRLPPKVDPEADPANVAAREELRSRVEQLAAELERTPEARAAVRAHLDRLDAEGAPP